MNTENNSNIEAVMPDLANAVKRQTATLQSIGDHRRVSEAVYEWLRMHNISIHEDGAEQLVGVMSAIVSRARAGEDRPTNGEVRANLEAGNRFAQEHNASPRTTTELPVYDLTKLSELLVD